MTLPDGSTADERPGGDDGSGTVERTGLGGAVAGALAGGILGSTFGPEAAVFGAILGAALGDEMDKGQDVSVL